MPRITLRITIALFILCTFQAVDAQNLNNKITPPATAPVITGSASAERLRFTAPNTVLRMQLQIYADSGEMLFDVTSKGNVLDWTLQDSGGEHLVPGSYLCVVTVKSLSGKLNQRIGLALVQEKQVQLQPADATVLSAAQQLAVGPIEENGGLTILKAGEAQAATLLANDGQAGHIIRDRGALTFRVGNFFTGNDTEQMRLTEAGNLGIGTSDPRSRLDVAGTIRAERFLVVKPAKPGSAPATETLATNVADTDQPLIAGTGTQDRIAKWTDSAGTLGDSGITETGGNVGIGTTAPSSKLVVSANSSTLPPVASIARFADADGVQTAVFADAFGTNPLFNVRRANGTAAAPSAVQANQILGVIGASGFGASAYTGTRARVAFLASENWTNTANGTYLTFNTTANGAATAGGTERLRVDSAGNVGIGTSAPGAKLDVAGDINTSTQYNIGGSRVLGGTVSNLFVGIGAGNQSSATGTFNTFLGIGTGGRNGDGSNNVFVGSFAGDFSQSGDFNTFVGSTSGGNTITGSHNTVLGNFARTTTDLSYATAIGAEATVSSSNTIALGRSDGSDIVDVPGKLQIDTMAATGGDALCLNASARVALCMASSLRYKTQVHSFLGGLDIVSRLRPITFTWKEDGARDLGLGAEEVASVEPLLTFRNKRGEIEGVKYNQLSAVLINAVKEQQQQITQQQAAAKQQQEQIAALRAANAELNTRLRLIERTLKNKRGPTRRR